MANLRTVINPFTRNEHRMRRSTTSTKWVIAGSSAITRRDIDVETQTAKCISQESISSSHVKGISPRARAPLSTRDEIRRLPLKSTAVCTNVSHRDTPLSALQLIDFSRLEQTLTESDVNISPHCPASLEEPKSNTKSSWRKQDLDEGFDTSLVTSLRQTHVQQQAICGPTPLYRAAKEIYHIGPKGEGQKVWQVYQQARSHRRAGGEPTQNASSEAMVEERKSMSIPPFQTSLDGVLFPPLRPRPPQTQSGGERRETGSRDPRRDSGFSSSSYEVPVAMEKSIQSTVTANKPLPPVPQLDAALTVGRTKDRPPGDSRQHTEKEANHTWWKHSPSKAAPSLKSKISHPGPLMVSSQGSAVNIAAECGGVGGPAAAVSLPVSRRGAPLARPPRTLETKKDVGRPMPRSFHLPTLDPSPSKRMGKGVERERGAGGDDAHATHWCGKFVGPAYEAGKSLKQTAMDTLDGVHVGRKKRTSDVSFACQGIVDGKLDRYQVGEEPSSSDDEVGMLPDALFYVNNMGAYL